ncbi:hypothetical protein [Pseudomonas putida]
MSTEHTEQLSITIHRTFQGRPITFRQDGYIEFKSLIRAFRITPDLVVDALRAFPSMIVEDPNWHLAIQEGSTACDCANGSLWMPLKVFNHIGAFLEIHPDFPRWYQNTVIELALDEARRDSKEEPV